MRHPPAIVAAAALLAFCAPAAAQDWDCDDPGNLPQQGMNWCAAMEFHEADRALNAAWKSARAFVKAAESDSPDLFEGWWQTMLDGQRAWLGYRDGQCASEGMKFGGGSLEPLIVATCRTELTERRTEELLEIAEPW